MAAKWRKLLLSLARIEPPWGPDLVALRAQHFREAADVLDEIGHMQDCFDDDEMQQQAQETYSCARVLRLYATGIAGNRKAPS
jgi:hypothetical protein